MTFGQLLKSKRKELGLTQMDIAEKLNVSVLTISKWEGEEVLPTEDETKLLKEIFGIDSNTITKESQDKNLEAKEEKDQVLKEQVDNTPILESQEVKVKATIEKPQEEVQKEELKTSIDVDDKPVLGNCIRCRKQIKERDDFVTVEYKANFERRTVCLCKNCKSLCQGDLLKQAREKRIENTKNERKKALIIQALITGIGFLFAAMWIAANYIATIVIAVIAFNVGLLVANCIFNNTAPFKLFREIAASSKEAYDDYKEFKRIHPFSSTRYASLYDYLLVLYTPFLFIFSIFIYPIALIKSINTKKDNSQIIVSNYEKDAYYAKLDTKFYFDKKHRNNTFE